MSHCECLLKYAHGIRTTEQREKDNETKQSAETFSVDGRGERLLTGNVTPHGGDRAGGFISRTKRVLGLLMMESEASPFQPRFTS